MRLFRPTRPASILLTITCLGSATWFWKRTFPSFCHALFALPSLCSPALSQVSAHPPLPHPVTIAFFLPSCTLLARIPAFVTDSMSPAPPHFPPWPHLLCPVTDLSPPVTDLLPAVSDSVLTLACHGSLHSAHWSCLYFGRCHASLHSGYQLYHCFGHRYCPTTYVCGLPLTQGPHILLAYVSIALFHSCIHSISLPLYDRPRSHLVIYCLPWSYTHPLIHPACH